MTADLRTTQVSPPPMLSKIVGLDELDGSHSICCVHVDMVRCSRRFPSQIADGEDYYDLPELPGIHLAEIGPSRSPVARYDLCGSAMDVNTTAIGVGNIQGWDEDTAEIAFYESTSLPTSAAHVNAM